MVYHIPMNFFYFVIYAVYLAFNALMLKLSISWGFEHEIGWKSALMFSFLTSTFALFHKNRVKPE
jgi:hypothetical protein